MNKRRAYFKQYLMGRAFSFKYAFNGLFYAIQTQKNIRIHLVATVVVLLFSALVKITPLELTLIVIVIGIVWIAEIFNTAIEKLVDLCSPQYHLLAKLSKDLAAAGVLVAAMTAVLVGIIVFLPYVLKLIIK
jgi:diacylglycerol kinase